MALEDGGGATDIGASVVGRRLARAAWRIQDAISHPGSASFRFMPVQPILTARRRMLSSVPVRVRVRGPRRLVLRRSEAAHRGAMRFGAEHGRVARVSRWCSSSRRRYEVSEDLWRGATTRRATPCRPRRLCRRPLRARASRRTDPRRWPSKATLLALPYQRGSRAFAFRQLMRQARVPMRLGARAASEHTLRARRVRLRSRSEILESRTNTTPTGEPNVVSSATSPTGSPTRCRSSARRPLYSWQSGRDGVRLQHRDGGGTGARREVDAVARAG